MESILQREPTDKIYLKMCKSDNVMKFKGRCDEEIYSLI